MSIEKLGLGCSRLGSVSGVTGKYATQLLNEAYDSGIRWYDTANIYGQGESEKLLGLLKRQKGEGVKITTKAGYAMPSLVTSGKVNWVKPLLRTCIKKIPLLRDQMLRVRGAMGSQQNFEQDYIANNIDKSRQRLSVDEIDEFLLHSPSVEILREGSVFRGLKKLKKDGVIKRSGVALVSSESIEYLPDDCGLDVVQLELNLLSEKEDWVLVQRLKDRCKVDIVARQPFAGGRLIVAAPPVSERHQAIMEIASDYSIDIKVLALKFLIEHSVIDRVLIGTTSISHLRDNISIVLSEELDTEVSLRLREI